MQLVFSTNPAPVLILRDPELHNIDRKTIGLSNFDAGNRIANLVASGRITVEDLLAEDIVTGADVFRKYPDKPKTKLIPHKIVGYPYYTTA